jgi:hypothetical protein
MKGTVTFYFKNGFHITKQIGSNCKGIMVKDQRPINFILDIDKQSISSHSIHEELDKFKQWINNSVFPGIKRR